eukprot:jgi/Tetstr1/428409/TSEL_001845.t1
MLDTKKPELELHAAQLDDCRINPSNLEEAGPQRLGTVSVTRKQREKFHVMEKAAAHKANMATGVSRKRPRAET